MKDNKELCKVVINLLTEDGFFENEWIDESKFRPRFYKATEHIKFEQTEECVNRFIGFAEVVAKSIIRENVDTTLKALDLNDKFFENTNILKKTKREKDI